MWSSFALFLLFSTLQELEEGSKVGVDPFLMSVCKLTQEEFSCIALCAVNNFVVVLVFFIANTVVDVVLFVVDISFILLSLFLLL